MLKENETQNKKQFLNKLTTILLLSLETCENDIKILKINSEAVKNSL